MKLNIDRFRPCPSGLAWYESQPDIKTAWENCHRGDWMLWIAKKLYVEKRVFTLAKGKCAETVIHLMRDDRSKKAVIAAIDYGNGVIDDATLAAAADAAAYAAYAVAAYAYAAYAYAAYAYAAYAARIGTGSGDDNAGISW